MKLNTHGSLGPNETTLILQGEIEGLTPQQILIRDELVESGHSGSLASAVVKGGISLQEAEQMIEICGNQVIA